ncbi:DUF3088 domain-containing protein [Paenibacillus sp. SYP-B3998]|uniref:DUF3088 domain-containing protein n=1 Tax=Paenibacillus sp. SYP-B3998 TaxID=2678564 RepID=A0A6G3ZYL0_9BACL|nr:DUF3088 domain-containing protein [Paenibacillus sp. SYP-B3998]NEW06669.1 DUF3088 domain-containing protein [Paenibacillus sp. SYP-B3998]
MSDDLLVIKYNLLPWYNELDDRIDVEQVDFPTAIRERIQALGEYNLKTVTRKETQLEKIKER